MEGVKPEERPVEYLTVRECASRLRVTPQALYLRVARGELPTVHIGAAMRIPKEAFEAWIEQNTTPAKKQPGRDTGHVFTSATAPGEHLREVTVSRAFKRLLNEASLPNIRFHDLRHTCATLLFSEGAYPKVVQEMLGHSSVAITMDRYAHWIPSMGE
jgi:excisionase family DNA binding protein